MPFDSPQQREAAVAFACTKIGKNGRLVHNGLTELRERFGLTNRDACAARDEAKRRLWQEPVVVDVDEILPASTTAAASADGVMHVADEDKITDLSLQGIEHALRLAVQNEDVRGITAAARAGLEAAKHLQARTETRTVEGEAFYDRGGLLGRLREMAASEPSWE